MNYFNPATMRPAAVPATMYGAFSALAASVGHLGTTAINWSHRYQQRTRLAHMSDHLLADMGISRADADLEASKPFWQA